MFVYIPDWHMYYELDAFRYDKDAQEVVLTIAGYRIEIILKNICRKEWLRIRVELLRGIFFEINRRYEWDMALLNFTSENNGVIAKS